jgi:hypothetical protein
LYGPLENLVPKTKNPRQSARVFSRKLAYYGPLFSKKIMQEVLLKLYENYTSVIIDKQISPTRNATRHLVKSKELLNK